jgi:hypothetical protein
MKTLPAQKTPRPLLGYVAIPVLIGLIVLFESWHFASFFRLFTFGALALLLCDIAWLTGGKTRDFFVILASMCVGLCAIECIADLMLPHAPPVIAPRNVWSQPQSDIGWGASKPGRYHDYRMDFAGRTIYSVSYTIDRDLLRQTLSCKKGPAIVFFGCSFTFGEGVNDDQTLPQNFADQLDRKVRILNLGFSGYGPQQFLREEETGRFDQVIGPNPRLFVFLTAVWHAQRTACKASWTARAPRYALENGRLVYVGQCIPPGPSLLLHEWLENVALYRELVEPYRWQLTNEDVELYVRILSAAVELAKSKYNASTVVLYVRSDDKFFRGTGFSDDEIMRRLSAAGAIVVDASLQKERHDGAQINIAGNGHPTPYANQLRASILKTYLAERAPNILQPAAHAECSNAQ